jgi:serine/threonine protein kinase
VKQIVEGVAYFHEKKVLHRDLKPDNIIVSSEKKFTVKILDFGVSKILRDQDMERTKSVGTAIYSPPQSNSG